MSSRGTNIPDPDDADDVHHVVSGVDLRQLLDRPAPFATLFLSAGPDVEGRARATIDRVPIPAPQAGLLLDAIDCETAGSQMIVTGASGGATTVLLDDPFTTDIARFGRVPALAPLLEADQMTAAHAAVTVEDDVFAVTNFGSTSSRGDDAHVFEAIEHLIDHLRHLGHPMVAVIGSQEATSDVVTYLSGRLTKARIAAYPTTDIDADLPSLADEIVRDAASLAAERRTHDLAHFREARRAGLSVEGPSVLAALDEHIVQRLLVHDDFDDVTSTEVGPADFVIAEGVRQGVPITMIPDVGDDRGPVGGIGGILGGEGASVFGGDQPEQVRSRVLSQD